MNNVQYEQSETGLNAPPRGLLLLAFGFLALVVIVGIALALYLTGGRRISAVLPFAALMAILVPLVIVSVALVFRRDLPRYLWVWLTGIFAVLMIAGVLGGITFYRSGLPPRYQEEVREQLPFMGAFLPPTPVGGLIPTVAATSGGITAMDLLNMPLAGSTPPADVPAAAALVTAEATPEIALQTASSTPTPSPSPTSTATAIPPTDLPATATPEPATAQPLPTQTQVAAAPTVVPTTEVASGAPFSRPAAARMYGFRHEQQQWNNCGPTNVTMALSFFGWQEDQTFAAQFLRPNDEDKNVSPHELVQFVNEQSQIRALYRVGGSTELLKYFIAANLPVIVETAYTPEGYDWIGHYQTVVGYDDSANNFYIYDSFLGSGLNGEGIAEPYREFDANWQAFNRVFIVLYRPEDEALVAQILGDHASTEDAATLALAMAQREARANPQNMFAWFNMGSSYTRLGQFPEAAAAYDQARRLGLPFRMNWYQFGMFEAYYNVQRYDDVLALVQTNLTNGAQYVEETHYWQGRVLESQGDTTGAAVAYQRALTHNPRYEAAQTALAALST